MSPPTTFPATPSRPARPDSHRPRPPRFGGAVTRGVVGGILGATVMAVWFLVIDGSQGAAFRTPAFIASALLGLDQVQVAAGPVALYTLIHYAAWVVVGVGVSSILTVVDTSSPVLLGLVLGFALFDVVFYGSVGVTGVDVVDRLGWPSVLVGNLAAGVATVGFLHAVGGGRDIVWWERVTGSSVVREGVVAGLVGAGAVAVWFLLVDLALGRPLFTPAALGSTLFLGVDRIADVRIDAVTVAAYTVLHLTAFVVAGLLAATVTAAAERTPPLVLGAVLFFAAFEAFFMGGLAILAEYLLGALAWWAVAIGNLVAAATMGGYLWRRHPRLRDVLSNDLLERTD